MVFVRFGGFGFSQDHVARKKVATFVPADIYSPKSKSLRRLIRKIKPALMDSAYERACCLAEAGSTEKRFASITAMARPLESLRI